MDYSKLYKYKQEQKKPEENQAIHSDEAKFDEEQKPKVKKFRFIILLFIVGGSLLFILYVANVVQVKSYLKEEILLEKQLQSLKDKNHLLKKRINELESPERITKIAQEEMGMIKPNVPPKFLPKK